MKRIFKLVLAVVVFAAVVFPVAVQAEEKPCNYVEVKGGLFKPTGSDLSSYTTGFNGEIAFGHYFTKNLAMELSAGYFHSSANEVYYYMPEKVTLDVVPLTVALKAALPVNNFELYAIGGLGAYIVHSEVEGSYAYAAYDDKETRAVFGGFLGLGANLNITKNMFLGIEGKYFYTTRVNAIDYDLYGIQATLNMGFRF